MKIGIAGVGRMGAAIALRLMEVGHELTVWNRSAAKLKPLVEAGAKVAATPKELANSVETIITILTDAAAIDAVYDGPSGLLSGDVKGKLVIEMSTVRPETEIALAKKVRAKGAAYVECPVGGTTGPARQGKLIGLMGGEPADTARAKPILDQLCRRLEHVGAVGNGAIMKFAINLPLMISWQAFGEAIALCRPLGLDPARLMDLFGDTSGGTNAVKNRGPAIAKMLAGADPGPVGFDVDSGRKDLRAMLAEGKARGIELPLAAGALAAFDEASARGLGAKDGSSLVVYWSERKKS
ncbi:MAG TPA: NAD(P)-dependent oxidoreductase [Xanthobacteraceae bacterium]|nr:NAD(P)-dependent oxidoreductase [Xanthobacteraceae bacterium]